MANLKHSRQRAAIRQYLAQTSEHPTADMVYLHVREEFPNISLGTVYRNLNLLADMGEAIKIPTPDGGDRFDGRSDAHYHLVCRSCGKVFDLELDKQHILSVNELASRYFDGTVDSHTTLFYGTCKACGDGRDCETVNGAKDMMDAASVAGTVEAMDGADVLDAMYTADEKNKD